MNRGEKAVSLFESGCNCAQAVAVAFCDVMGLTPEQAAKLSSGFGGGMGRMREVCGAVSGMVMVLGAVDGYDRAGDDEIKMKLYQKVQTLAGEFRSQQGTIICRELLDNPPADPNPTPRSPEFYQLRPCARFVYTAAELLEQYLADRA